MRRTALQTKAFSAVLFMRIIIKLHVACCTETCTGTCAVTLAEFARFHHRNIDWVCEEIARDVGCRICLGSKFHSRASGLLCGPVYGSATQLATGSALFCCCCQFVCRLQCLTCTPAGLLHFLQRQMPHSSANWSRVCKATVMLLAVEDGDS